MPDSPRRDVWFMRLLGSLAAGGDSTAAGGGSVAASCEFPDSVCSVCMRNQRLKMLDPYGWRQFHYEVQPTIHPGAIDLLTSTLIL